MEGSQLEDGVEETEPFRLNRERLRLAEESETDVKRFRHPRSKLERIQPQHRRIGEVSAGTNTKHDASASEVVKEEDPVRDHQRVVIWKADCTGPEANMAGALRSDGEKQFR